MKIRAVRIREPGDPSVLELVDRELRDPGPGEVLVEVAAAGLNRADLLQRRGRYPAPPGAPPDVPGLEYSGRIVAAGAGVGSDRIGARVMGIVGGGAMATHVVVHVDETIAVPDRLTDEQAAAVPEAYLTSWDAMVARAALKAGETVLIHAVGSGIGTAALQLANQLGARPIGTSRTRAKLERCAPLGLVDGIECPQPAFADEVLRLTHGAGVNVVIDTVGASYFSENLRSLAVKGRMVLLGTMGGAVAEVPLGAWMARRATIIGSVLRSRSLAEKIVLAQTFSEQVLRGFLEGALAPVIDDVMPITAVQEAHARLESNDSFGKLVLRW